MSYSEELRLSLRLSQRIVFIDADYLEKTFLKEIPHLHTFIFDIVVDHLVIDGETKPSFDDIQRTFIQRGYHVNGHMECNDYLYSVWHRCHVYSLPTIMEYLQPISHSFSGDIFMNVRDLWIREESNPFEPSFFVKISQSFPFLHRLTITNEIEQNEKSKDVSPAIQFPHLIEVCYGYNHINYVEQFLSNVNTYIPSLIKLRI